MLTCIVPACNMLPALGRKAVAPVVAAGHRMLPHVSVPIAKGSRPVAQTTGGTIHYIECLCAVFVLNNCIADIPCMSAVQLSDCNVANSKQPIQIPDTAIHLPHTYLLQPLQPTQH